MRRLLPFVALGIGVFLVMGLTCNGTPTITLVEASATVVDGADIVMLTVTATDPDGDPLTFTWTAPSGTFDTTTGDTVYWTPPTVTATETVTVTVTAEDGNGGSAVGTVDVDVHPYVVIGDKDQVPHWPFNGSAADYTRAQYLYHDSEITRNDTIFRVSLMPYTPTPNWGAFDDFEMYLCPTARMDLQDTFALNYGTNTPTLVYSNTHLTYGNEDEDRWFWFDLDTPFAYDGGDLLLEMFWEGDSDVTVRTCGWNTQYYRENYTHVKGREIEPPNMLCLHLKLTFLN